MSDLSVEIGRVWDPEVRPLADEAWRCYGVGAYRAAVALTWVAVCADLTNKIVRLADDGDGVAASYRVAIEAAQRDGLSASGIKATQELERSLIQHAVDVELIDTVTARELNRLREDRHLCAHPSLREVGEPFDPQEEVARAHLAVALEAVLTVPPTQGRRVVDRFASHVADIYFTASPDYLLQTFFERVRPGARRRIIDLAVKHAVAELPAPDPPGAQTLADRMAKCVAVFCQRDRPAVRDALQKALERPQLADGGTLLRAVGRVGDLDVFWDLTDDATAARINELVAAIKPQDVYGNLAPDQSAILSVVGFAAARERLPALETTFLSLHPRARASVMAQRVRPYFTAFVAPLLAEAGGWRSAEDIARNAVIPYGSLLSAEQLADVLAAWAANDQCRTASGMLGLATELFDSTRHLHPVDLSIWQHFLEAVRSHELPTSAYRYGELERYMMSTT